MTHTQFFTDSIARTLEDALAAAGIILPVYGQVSEPEAEHDRVEVRCNNTEEVIPGNYTTRLDCSVVLLLSATMNSAAEVEATGAAVGAVVCAVLKRPWKMVPLADPRAETDAEYEKAPFIVLDLVPEPANVEAGAEQYEMAADFRAYVQF